MQVRRADEGDADAIAVLVADAYGHYIERIGRRPKPMTMDQHAAVRDHEVWVARDVVDDSLVGVLELIAEPGRLFIENVAVAPGRQGEGLGGQLLDLAELEARRRGCHEVASKRTNGSSRTWPSTRGAATGRRAGRRPAGLPWFRCPSDSIAYELRWPSSLCANLTTHAAQRARAPCLRSIRRRLSERRVASRRIGVD